MRFFYKIFFYIISINMDYKKLQKDLKFGFMNENQVHNILEEELQETDRGSGGFGSTDESE